MTTPNTNQSGLVIDYVEFTAADVAATTAFFARAFGWGLVNYGPGYQALAGAGLDGGVAQGDAAPPLVVLKAQDLEQARDRVHAAGGLITRAIYAFPGGRRFHFREPGGTEMAVWSPN